MTSITTSTSSSGTESQQHWTCPSCKSVVTVEETNWSNLKQEEEEHFHQVSPVVKCISCDKSVGLRIHGQFNTIEQILKDERKKNSCCWCRVQDESDRRVLFTLSQIIYQEFERPDVTQLECEFAFPPLTDIAKILWVSGDAVGFYTLKPKGTLDMETLDTYSMVTLDTIFIRKAHRRKGYASTALSDLLTEYPNENIGFSQPLSLTMMKVLEKHLEKSIEDRSRMWEISECGGEGNCRNLWLILQRQRKGRSS